MAAKRKETRITREIGPLTLRASVAPSSLDEEKRTVEIVWTTGAKVLRGFDEQYYEELSLDPRHVRMDRLNSGAPLLDAHNSYELGGVIGVVESARLEKGRGVATVRFARAADDENAERIFRKVKDGVIRNVSVGYRVYRYEKTESEDDNIPTYLATDWEPYEVSLVPIGADAQARVRAVTEESAGLNRCEFVEPQEERVMKDKRNHESAAPAAESETAMQERSESLDAEAIRREAAAAERKRAADIRRAGRALGLDAAFVEEHIERGTDVATFRALAIDKAAELTSPVAPGGPPSVVHVADERDKWLRGAEHWLIQRAAVADIVVEAARKRGETLSIDPGEFRGMTFVDLARQALERGGATTKGMTKMDVIGRALTMRGGSNTTGDFPVLLENVMHKTLLAGYMVTPDTWSLFCARGSVSDFRPHYRYRMGSFGRLQKANEHGEFQNQSIPDAERQQISAETKGNIIALSRQALVNDDMSAFSRLATMLGRAARLSIEMDVYETLASNGGLGPTMSDGDTLFHANHDNIGAGSPLSVAGLDADRIVMAEQTDPSGNEILDLRPAILVVPIGLGGDARVINEAQFDVDAVGANATNKFMKPNKVRGLFRTIVDTPRLSGTRRYLFADPAIAPVLEVAFLDGQDMPFLEAQDGWRIDGVEWKVRLDYGVGAVDYRGAVTNQGA